MHLPDFPAFNDLHALAMRALAEIVTHATRYALRRWRERQPVSESSVSDTDARDVSKNRVAIVSRQMQIRCTSIQESHHGPHVRLLPRQHRRSDHR